MMVLPVIPSYLVPTESELPPGRADWKPDASRAVLLIHDMQQYFIDPFPAGQSPIRETIVHIDLLRARCAELGIPVVYSAQPGDQKPEQRALLQDFWGPGMADKEVHTRIIPELAPGAGDTQLTKWRYSAFVKTELAELLRELGRDQLIICGVYAHIGCLMTACDAFMRDIQPFLIADAVADFSRADHDMALRYAASRCAAVMTAQALLQNWRGTDPAADAAEAAHVRSGGDSAVPGKQEAITAELVREQVAELLQETPEAIGEADNLIDWGLDSIRIMSLVEQWRRQGTDVSFVELAERPTLGDWWRLLRTRRQALLPNADYFGV